MPIEHFAGGTVITGDSISFLQLVAQKGAVQIELKTGLRMRRGRRLWKILRDHYKIPKLGKRGQPIRGNANERDVLRWLTLKVEELAPQQEHIETDELGRPVRQVAGQRVS